MVRWVRKAVHAGGARGRFGFGRAAERVRLVTHAQQDPVFDPFRESGQALRGVREQFPEPLQGAQRGALGFALYLRQVAQAVGPLVGRLEPPAHLHVGFRRLQFGLAQRVGAGQAAVGQLAASVEWYAAWITSAKAKAFPSW